MKGIILACGLGTKIDSLTKAPVKQNRSIYDVPTEYYPLSTLMAAGIKDILIISTPEDILRFEALLGNGSRFGITLSYKVQPSPDGLAQALILAEEFLAGGPGALILGNNIFYGDGFEYLLKAAAADAEENGRATVFGCYVPDPEHYAVVEFDERGKAIALDEKSKDPRSNYAVTGLYFYPADVAARADTLTPSARGELEIATLNKMYLNDGLLDVQILGRGFIWINAGGMSLLRPGEVMADFIC